MMNKKGEMLVRDYFACLILFGMVTGAGALMVISMANSETGYDIENMTDDAYQTRYDTFTNSTRDVYKMSNETASNKGMSVVSTYTTMFTATFSVIAIILSSFGLVKNTGAFLMTDAGVPSLLGDLLMGGIVAIVIGTLVFVIISSISRGKL